MTSTIKKLGLLDRYLTVWILLAMAVGVLASHFIPASRLLISHFNTHSGNWIIGVGLIVMMYPPLAKVRYSAVPRVFKNTKLLALSFSLNWLIGLVNVALLLKQKLTFRSNSL